MLNRPKHAVAKLYYGPHDGWNTEIPLPPKDELPANIAMPDNSGEIVLYQAVENIEANVYRYELVSTS